MSVQMATSSAEETPPPPQTSTSAACGFLDLSAEVRVMVYRCLLLSREPVHLAHHHYLHHANAEVYGSILRVNRSTYRESHSLLYGANSLYFDMTLPGDCSDSALSRAALSRAALSRSAFFHLGRDALCQIQTLTVRTKHMKDLLPRARDRHQVDVWKQLCAMPNLQHLTLDFVCDYSSAAVDAISYLLYGVTSCPSPPQMLLSLSTRQPSAPRVTYGIGDRSTRLKFNHAFAAASFTTLICPTTKKLEIRAQLYKGETGMVPDEAGKAGAWHLVAIPNDTAWDKDKDKDGQALAQQAVTRFEWVQK